MLLPRTQVNKVGIRPRFIENSLPPASMDGRSNPAGVAREKEVALKRRLLLVLTVALVMAAMMLVMVAPAMGARPCPPGQHPKPSGPGGLVLCVPNGPPFLPIG